MSQKKNTNQKKYKAKIRSQVPIKSRLVIAREKEMKERMREHRRVSDSYGFEEILLQTLYLNQMAKKVGGKK